MVACALTACGKGSQPARFEQLLTLCSHDFSAYPGHSTTPYPKAPRMRRALAAYLSVAQEGRSDEAWQQARAVVIDAALRGGVGAGG